MAKLNAYQTGVRAAASHVDISANPHPEWTSDGKAWLVGWREVAASQAAIAALGPKHWLRAG